MERRSSQDCVGYQPPGGGAVFGDPHFYTFDGMPYTFNGKGEFVLARANSPRVKLDVQGRFEQVRKIYIQVVGSFWDFIIFFLKKRSRTLLTEKSGARL